LKNIILKLNAKLNNLFSHEEGQDLVEYALLITMVALATVGGVKHVATAINTVFSNISATLS
jgi:pilus assembly protein Flp/PilA